MVFSRRARRAIYVSLLPRAFFPLCDTSDVSYRTVKLYAWAHPPIRDGHQAEELIELFVISNSSHDVTRTYTGLVAVLGSVASQLKNLSAEILEHGCKVDRSSSTDALPGGVLAILEVATYASHWKLQTSLE